MTDDRSAYASAGVDIDAAQRALRQVKDAISKTHGQEVLGGIGGFGAMFEPDFKGYERPVLVSSVDGVGTKTKVAAMVGDYSGIGADIVNHCVNDILCQGAKPLFFLDYFGCSRLENDVFIQVVQSAAQACAEVGCALIGGETAEMPGVYLDGETDVVGSIVGLVERAQRLPRPGLAVGDRLIGVMSDGLHTNGYSLARRALFDLGGLSVGDSLGESSETIGQALLRPHRCYFRPLEALLSDSDLHGLAHITGGGLYDNLVRVLPSGARAIIEKSSWDVPPIFREIQRLGKVEDVEMYRAFNMGIGMVAVVADDSAQRIVDHLVERGERAAVIGEVQMGATDVALV